MSFKILIDTGSDLSAEEITSYGFLTIPLPIFMDGEPYRDTFETDEQIHDFYAAIRGEHIATTSCVSLKSAEDAARAVLDAGDDLLFIGFSSGLSSSTDAVIRYFQNELAPQYPSRTIECVDSLSVSGGFSLLLHYVAKLRDEGATLGELREWIEKNRLRCSHWFTVDDLMFLHRGGRVSRTSAIAGTMLNIKPVLHVDDEGHLIVVSKAKSRRKSLKALVDKMEETGQKPFSEQKIFINHGDALEDAQILEAEVREHFGCTDITIDFCTPVIGAHSGPGTISLFFLCSEDAAR